MAIDKTKLTGVEKVYPLNVSPYEQYMGDFQNPSVVSKVNAMIQSLHQIGRLTNETVSQWNNVMKWIVEGGMDEIAETITNEKVSVALEEVMRMLDVSLNNGLKELAENVSDKKIDELLESGQFESMIQSSLVEINEVVENKLDGFNLQLEEKITKSNLPIYLSERGVSHLKTATENTTIIKQAVAEAEASGRVIILPWVPVGQWVKINEPIQIAVGGITIQGFGEQSRLQQTVFPNAIFDVIAPNVTIERFFGSHSTFNASGFTTTFRGHLHKSFASAVAVYADNVTVRNIKGDNLINVVMVYGFDVGVGVRKPLLNVTVEDIESSNVDFALLVQDVKDFTFYRIKGSYKMMDGSTTPPHLIYFVNGEFKNVNVNGGDCVAFDGKDSNAFQLKGMKDSTIRNLSARNCSSTMNLMHNDGLVIKGVKHTGDLHDNQVFGSIEAQEDNNNVLIEDVVIEMNGTGKPFRFGSLTTNSTIRNAKIKSNHSLYDVANSYDVDIQGTNNLADNVDVQNLGSIQWTAGIGIWGGVGNTISRPRTSGNIRGVTIRTGIDHTLKNYQKKLLLPESEFIVSTSLINPQFFPESKTIQGIGGQDRLIAYERGDFGRDSNGSIGLTSSGALWSELSGLFKIVNKRIQAYSGASAIAVIETNANNIELSAGIKVIDREGFAFRVIDSNNYLFARPNSTSSRVELYKVVDGVSTQLAVATKTINNGRRYTFKVQAFNEFVDIYIEDVLLLSHTLVLEDITTFSTATKHGLRANTANSGFYDNIEWRNID